MEKVKGMAVKQSGCVKSRFHLRKQKKVPGKFFTSCPFVPFEVKTKKIKSVETSGIMVSF